MISQFYYLYNKEPQPQNVSRVFFKDWFMHHINSSLGKYVLVSHEKDYTLSFTEGNGKITHQKYANKNIKYYNVHKSELDKTTYVIFSIQQLNDNKQLHIELW